MGMDPAERAVGDGEVELGRAGLEHDYVARTEGPARYSKTQSNRLFISGWRAGASSAGVVSLIMKGSDVGSAGPLYGAGPDSVFRDVPYMYPNSVTMSSAKNQYG